MKFAGRKKLKKLPEYVSGALDINPRNVQDYVPVLWWMVSRRFLRTAILVIGVLSGLYLLWLHPLAAFGGDTRTYSYDSLALKFARGRVRIQRASGETAYEGEVDKGSASGKGVLYRKSGDIAYTGMFENNKFEGEGTCYYPGEKVQYEGNFENNLYSGEGVLYRKNGNKEYEGGFVRGKKHGESKLFDSGGNEVFAGTFQEDELLYTSLLGKSTEKLKEIYHGRRKIYTDGTDEFSAALMDIDAVYRGSQDQEALTDGMKVEGIYVLKTGISIRDSYCQSIPELRKLLGEPEYEGNSAVTFAEAVAISYLNEKKDCLFGPVYMELEEQFSDVAAVRSYQSDYLIYLYAYTLEQIRYTFYSDKKNGNISMYLIEKEP